MDIQDEGDDWDAREEVDQQVENYHGDHRIEGDQYQGTYTIDIQDKVGDCGVREERASQVNIDGQIDNNPDVIQEEKERELLKFCVSAFQQVSKRPSYIASLNNFEDIKENKKMSKKSEIVEKFDSEVSAAALSTCNHYSRSCKLVAPCCDKVYGCRMCHDEAQSSAPVKESHSLDRKLVEEVVCKKCDMRQPVAASCTNCQTVFGKAYFCPICRLYDDNDKEQYHCDGCGICRIGTGGKENYVHCNTCCLCFMKDFHHKCIENSDQKEEATQVTIDPEVFNIEDDKDKEEKKDKCDESYFIKAIDSLVNIAEVPEFDENHFPLKAAMTSLWVPCVVGEKDQKTFTKSAYSSLIFKTLILIISTILAFTGSYPYFVQKGTFMFFCFDNQTVNSLNQLQTTSIFDTTSTFYVCKENIFECFQRNNTELDQILHICGEDDELVKKILLGFTITLFGLALLATYCLNNLSSYITLYDVSKTFMWIPIKWVDPIFHRNLVFQIVGEMKFKKLRDLEDNDSCLQALNRQNSHGQSPLNVALENKDYNSVAVLLKKGAKIVTDSRKQRPLSIALNKNDHLSLQCLLKYNQEGQISIEEIEKHCEIATSHEEKQACMHLLTIEKHKAKKRLMTIPQSVFDWFAKTENYISSFPTFGFDQGAKEFELSGKGVRDIKSIMVITSLEKLKTPCGLEVYWSNGSIDKLGLRDDIDSCVTKTKVVTAPEGGYFTYVRCMSGDIVDAIAFDTEDSNGKVIRGEFIGGTGGNEGHSLECFDVDHMSVVLDGIKGKLHDTYDWLALTNLSFTYRIVQRKN